MRNPIDRGLLSTKRYTRKMHATKIAKEREQCTDEHYRRHSGRPTSFGLPMGPRKAPPPWCDDTHIMALTDTNKVTTEEIRRKGWVDMIVAH